MLQVRTYIDKSRIDGIGLFAGEFIPKGKIVWKFVKGLDFVIKKDRLNKLSKIDKSFVLHFGYYDAKKGGYVICVDDARFFNHAENPNTDNPVDEDFTYASKDIQKGEEITCNYFEFDADAKSKFSKK